MIAEIVSNGMLSLPSSLAVVGLVPGVILIVFLGTFGLFTSWILIQFKLRHPEGKTLSTVDEMKASVCLEFASQIEALTLTQSP